LSALARALTGRTVNHGIASGEPHGRDEIPVMRRNLLVHSLVSFFFNSVVLVGVLNAILTS